VIVAGAIFRSESIDALTVVAELIDAGTTLFVAVTLPLTDDWAPTVAGAMRRKTGSAPPTVDVAVIDAALSGFLTPVRALTVD
jgi:hypothetical protein